MTGSTAAVSLVVCPNSFRAAAIATHDSGDSAGAVGELPANGLSNSRTTWEIAVDAVCAGGFGFGVATIKSAVAAAGETAALAAGFLAGASASATMGSVFDETAACERTVAVAVSAVFGGESRTDLLECAATSGFFFFFGFWSAVVLLSSAADAGVAVSSEGCFLSDAETPAVDELLEPEPAGVSADATPCPTKTAAPIPRATANPPIRPTYAPAPMAICIP